MDNVVPIHDDLDVPTSVTIPIKSDPTGFSLSYDGPTPHPVGDGALDAVPHAAVPRKARVLGKGSLALSLASHPHVVQGESFENCNGYQQKYLSFSSQTRFV